MADLIPKYIRKIIGYPCKKCGLWKITTMMEWTIFRENKVPFCRCKDIGG